MERPTIPQDIIEGSSKCSIEVETSLEGFHNMYRESIKKAKTDCEEIHIYQSYVRDLSGLLRNSICSFYDEQAKTHRDFMDLSMGDSGNASWNNEQRARMVKMMNKRRIALGDDADHKSDKSSREVERLQAQIEGMNVQMTATQQELDESRMFLLEARNKSQASQAASEEVKMLKGQVEDLMTELQKMRKEPVELFAKNYEEIKPLPFDESGSGDATSGDSGDGAVKVEAPEMICKKLQAKAEVNDRKVQSMQKQMEAIKVQTKKLTNNYSNDDVIEQMKQRNKKSCHKDEIVNIKLEFPRDRRREHSSDHVQSSESRRCKCRDRELLAEANFEKTTNILLPHASNRQIQLIFKTLTALMKLDGQDN